MRFIFGSLIVLGLLGVGVTNVSLNTGNDTLISNSKEAYKDNEYYQEQFGGDPIILLIESDGGYNLSSINLMNELQNDLKEADGIFAFNSPMIVFDQIGEVQKTQTISGLQMMSEGLSEVSTQLTTFSSNLSVDMSMSDQLETILSNLSNLQNAQTQLELGLTGLFTAVEGSNTLLETNIDQLDQLNIADETLATEINMVLAQLNQLNTNLTQIEAMDSLSMIPVQTLQALDQLIIGLEEMATSQEALVTQMTQMKEQLSTLANEFSVMSTTLAMMSSMISSFDVGIPKTEESLDMMLYEDGEMRAMFQTFMIDSDTVRIVMNTSSDLSQDNMEQILDSIDEIKRQYPTLDVLVSGKPVLDYDIKSSMMGSMQTMMMFAAVIMVIVLFLVYPVRARLLPLIVIFMAVIATVGLMGWLNIGLTMVSMAVFPVLIGLGIDYSIQMQSRYEEVYTRGEQDA
jgi:predicted RND superfamily exporter protein